MSAVVLITGASRGIGAATALLAARQGYAVAVNYSANSLAADEVVRQIRQAGGTAMAVQADVADEAQVLTMFEKVDAKLSDFQGLRVLRTQENFLSGRTNENRQYGESCLPSLRCVT
jgi:NAD(P)-dependent dehydrogenase (short-subunit alcohol dehydrogenase family)